MPRLLKCLGGFGMLGLLLLITTGPANAAKITFNFNLCGATTNTGNAGSCGATTTYTVSGYTITATAEAPGSNNLLWAKNDSAVDEKGLGLTSDGTGDHEITPGFLIQLDISSIPVSDDPITIIMGSTTFPDEWKIFESNTAGATSGINTLTGGTEGTGNPITISTTDKYIDITAMDGNVLLSSLQFNTAATPEPSSLMLLGTGILGLAGAVRRKLMA